VWLRNALVYLVETSIDGLPLLQGGFRNEIATLQ
jgi:hypothetical protein